jgi:putative Mg2+ transporter-C (MgtC) family protein
MSTFLAANLDIFLRLGVAMIFGIVIGAERALINKEAGMKTHALVSLGAALFVVISEILATRYAPLGGFDASRIASQVVVGVGFLGAGAIIFQGNRLMGLTTAGGLWVTAGIGMAAGFGLWSISAIATILVLFVLVIVYFLERPLRRLSNDDSAGA